MRELVVELEAYAELADCACSVVVGVKFQNPKNHMRWLREYVIWRMGIESHRKLHASK